MDRLVYVVLPGPRISFGLAELPFDVSGWPPDVGELLASAGPGSTSDVDLVRSLDEATVGSCTVGWCGAAALGRVGSGVVANGDDTPAAD